ncbi:MAG: hypothetical protein ACJ74C_09095 [Gaiellaceae bacterium]
MEVHRSRYELERVLSGFGASEVLFVEADATASLQFELHGRYVQMAMPLPDPTHARFTHTPTGKPRAAAAQERVYEQALRQHWRSLVVAVRGKLQSVESGISTFDHEFERFFVPHLADEKTARRDRKAPKAVGWLLGGSHSLAIALVAASLVPASAVGAFALPTNVVGHLASPFRSAVRDGVNAADGADSGLALARGGWRPASGDDSSFESGARLSAVARGETAGEVRRTANLSAPFAEPLDAPRNEVSALASAGTTPLPSPGDGPAASPPPLPPASTGNSQGPASKGDDKPAPPAESNEPPLDSSELPTDASADAGENVTTPSGLENELEGATSDDQPASEPGDLPPAAADGATTPPGNGNGGVPPGQAKKDDPGNTPPAQANTPPGQANNPDNGNGNGNGNNGVPPGQVKKGNEKGGK